jgi:threonine dehydrogenase-like Zn-dependent dehydrogenase
MLSGSSRRLATIKATSSEVKLLAIPRGVFLKLRGVRQVVRHTLRVAVLGAGPVGLEFAAAATLRGWSVVLVERGAAVAHHVRQWGHVQLFSPNELNHGSAGVAVLEAAGKSVPEPGLFPTGEQFASEYLEPLAEALVGRGNCELRCDTEVVSVGRGTILKGAHIGGGARLSSEAAAVSGTSRLSWVPAVLVP